MKIKLIAVGKIKEEYITMGIKVFKRRIKPYVDIDIMEIMDEKAPETLSSAQLESIKDIEGNKILSKIKPIDYVVSLVIEGKQINSEDFADFLIDI